MLRNTHLRKRNVQKKKVEEGQEHLSTGKSGRTIPAKQFKPQWLCCKKKCSANIDVNRQLEIFSSYYKFSTWMSKTIFIRGCVSREKVNATMYNLQTVNPLKNRHFVYNYKLKDSAGIQHTVCRDFFNNCLQINNGRVVRALESALENPSAIDRRGRGPPKHKTKADDKQFLKKNFETFPTYESHYARKRTAKRYLAPNLNIMKLYREYNLKCEFQHRKILSEYLFRETFNKEFNIGIKQPKTDVCSECVKYKVKLAEQHITYNEKCILEAEKLTHLKTVENKFLEFRNDIDEAKRNKAFKVYTMDLQKTLETPSLNVSVAYYKRSLWTYNFCMYDEAQRKAFMYVWHEGVASRGADEISSCVKKRIDIDIAEGVEKVTIYSDSCGGQNKNIKLTLMLKKILCEHENLNEISQKFFVPGHSKNNCDRSFALVERQRKFTEDICIPDHWVNIISQAKKTEPKFSVHKMEVTDFYSSNNILKLVVNRKIDANKQKISWHDIDSITNIKGDPFSLYIKKKGETLQHKIDLHKKHVTEKMFSETMLEHTSENGRRIKQDKYNDLISLLRFIDIKYHAFYQNLQCDEDAEDYGLASNSETESEDE